MDILNRLKAAAASLQAPMGLKVVPHQLAIEVRTEFKVTSCSTRYKKRKGWRVLRTEVRRPGCFQVGDTLYMHPDLVAKLKQT